MLTFLYMLLCLGLGTNQQIFLISQQGQSTCIKRKDPQGPRHTHQGTTRAFKELLIDKCLISDSISLKRIQVVS